MAIHKTHRKPAGRRRTAQSVRTSARVVPITLEPKYDPAKNPPLTAEIPVAVKASGARGRSSHAKAVIPVAVTRQRKGRKTNLAVVPLVVQPNAANPVTGIVHAAIEMERHALDLGVKIARPAISLIGRVADFVVGAPRVKDVEESWRRPLRQKATIITEIPAAA